MSESNSYTKKLLIMGLGASQMGFLVAGGLLLGLWLDRHWDTSPWLGMIGLILGFSSGIHFLIRLVQISRRSS